MSSGKQGGEGVRVLRVADAPMERRTHGGYAFDRHIVIDDEKDSRCGVRVYSIPPGRANYPYHWHERHDEVFYILEGEGVLRTPQGERAVAPGELIVCPAGEAGAHQLRNPSADTPLRYLEFDAVTYPDIAHYPQTGAWGILFGEREKNQFYRDGRRVAYEAVDNIE